MPKDLPCIYRAADLGEADIVAVWLEEQGVRTFVKDRYAATGLYPLATSPRGIEVCVSPVDAERATELLQRRQDERLHEHAATPTESLIEVICRECGRTCTFPSERRRTVQLCPHCRGYLDVPDREPQ